MYKLCKTEQSATRQHELEQGLLAAMITHRYEEISVSDLCDRLNIPRKSFYRYFSGKDGALQALLDHTMMEYEAFSIGRHPGEKRTLQKELERFFCFWKHHRPLLDALERSNLSGMLIQRSVAYAISSAALPRRFLPRDSRELQEQVTMFAICGLMTMVFSWYREDFANPVSHMAEIAVRLISQPLFPDVDALI